MTETPQDESPDDIDALASEYVLGTLQAEQRIEVQKRLAQDTELRSAVDAWEQRLYPLTELVEAQSPTPRLWERIERSVNSIERQAPRATAAAQPNSWWNRLALWRGLAATGLVASLLLATALLTQTAQMKPITYLVVLVAPQNQTPGWVIQASSPREIQLIPLGGTQVPADKALEFWTKADGWQGPVSLGLVTPGQTLSVPLDKLPPLEPNQLFELTLESPTGSKTGKPTGPVQFIGRAVKVI
ncbi:anti-sigma factor [Pseudomonas sp. P66]|uniref:Anti-sigma factor n=2 Tax=Pseudomonas TaxID=286 RepID=A0ABT5PEH7_9PSED|nr:MULTISPECIES: anti-sigma factor [Pseudomonas]MBM5456415.1 anti-sigma factor [Pseudomonas arcuscaelestis]MDD1016725.1 anti-sigma factor [Pseudomonas rubra]MDD1040888.1 anti-sigma factor [Pseudomonas rubra]MDD1157514.1 anti-sigma factor [Pseudomonas rubra]